MRSSPCARARFPRTAGSSLLTLLCLLCALTVAGRAGAAALTPELQKQVRAATFEVVTKKPEKDSVTYEKPLPLELIPFQERNDKYWSLGTAFAIGPNEFVTAGHVLVATIASQFGTPAIRDGAGNVYPIDRILKYRNHEDFVVFSVSGAPPQAPLTTNTQASVDDAVFAVGNALGEGVVIRDGLLTSLTPEAKDGKWKWLRFSAAASPGNSGGPLLDSQGRVIGVVAAKSPNENLNYALPIESVLGDTGKLASFDERDSFGKPKLLTATVVTEFSDSFPLPLPFAEFATRVRAELVKYYRQQQEKLMASVAPQLFPHGQSATLLAKLYDSFDPAIIAQQEQDGTWDLQSCHGNETRLPGDGRVWHCRSAPVGSLFRLQYPGTTFDEHHYHDSREFMDLLLRGINVPRDVGSQAVRITSFGPALKESEYRDHFGRVWQQRWWSLGFGDFYVLTLALPTPDGYVGYLTLAPSGLLEIQTLHTQFLADFLYVSYTGSLAQWQAYLQHRELRAASLEHVKLQYEADKGLRFESPRLHLDTSGLMTVDARSALDLEMNYMMDSDKLDWDVAGVVVHQDRDRKTFLAAYRQPKPGDDAAKDRRERWDKMSKREAEFSGKPGHDDNFTDFWVRTVAVAATPGRSGVARPMYEVVYNTDRSLLPREMEDLRDRLAGAVKVTE